MKRVRLFAVSQLLIVTMLFTNCGKEETGLTIVVTDWESITQTLYADETDGGSSSFYTTGAWTSVITTSLSSGLQPEEPPSWVSVSPDHGDVAGDYTITITFERNTTGEDRTAVIRILCGEKEYIIDITQKGTKEDGTLL
jgi:hypothetical protein